jgi:hypothetical protein
MEKNIDIQEKIKTLDALVYYGKYVEENWHRVENLKHGKNTIEYLKKEYKLDVTKEYLPSLEKIYKVK